MSLADRAAQFSPFAALTGHDAAIRETARLTDMQAELDETVKAMLDEKLRLLLDQADHCPQVSITYFLPDEKKDGGAYVTVTGIIKRVDDMEHVILLTDGQMIPVGDVVAIDSDLFDRLM